jgi:hypothetical protein
VVADPFVSEQPVRIGGYMDTVKAEMTGFKVPSIVHGVFQRVD